MRRRWIIAATPAVAALLFAGAWLGLPRAEQLRADSDLAAANAHIGQANAILAGIDVQAKEAAGFGSLDSIHQSRDALAQAAPQLDRSGAEIGEAAADANAAAGMSWLPAGYREYLQKKGEIAGLRLKQIGRLKEAAARLQQLYGSGDVIFQALNDMDRLLGELQSAMAKVQSSPSEAETSLDQTAQSMRSVQQQLDQQQARTGFDLLSQLSSAVGDDAQVADLAAQLAGAAAAGDQARAQASAQALAAKLLSLQAGTDAVDLWRRQNVAPLLADYDALQNQEEQLDTEAGQLMAGGW